ncbi:N-alpha-acetyltransferase 50 [Trichinella spiralis]|uniref:N-terminal methionine N(alpha)-acetyltransferase NatE n=1 Tax=Trichinella spiralis TaxID=6334 RepID=A0A0V1BET4_TRISP|nr:N-alpha-acetyltransferase 50 [Trichinella spiralis]
MPSNQRSAEKDTIKIFIQFIWTITSETLTNSTQEKLIFFKVHRFNLTIWNVLTTEKAQFIPSKVWQRSASVPIAIVPFEEVDGAALLFCHPSNVASTPIFKRKTAEALHFNSVMDPIIKYVLIRNAAQPIFRQMSISCSVLAFTRSAVCSFSEVLGRRMLRRCDRDERLSCEQFRDAILYSRFKTSKAEMDLVVKAIDHNQDGFVDLAEFLHALRVDSEMLTDDKKIAQETEKQLNLCSCKEKYPVEERINGIVFPVNYNARFYEDVLSTTNIAKFAYFNDIVVGAMCCRILLVNNEKKLYIMTLGCLPNYRRFGLGTMMLEHVFDYCRKNSSISGIFLHVQVNNDVALEFYRKFGFEVHSVVENYYKRITPADAFLLVKRLDGVRRNDNVKEVQLV